MLLSLLTVLLFLVFTACVLGIIYPYRKGLKRWQFALGACASIVLLMAVSPQYGENGESLSIISLPFLFLLLASFVGMAYPFIRNSKRWHFALGTIVSFIGIGIVLPDPTPEQIAAHEAEETFKVAKEAQSASTQGNQAVMEKAKPALDGIAPYARSEYRDTYALVGPATFAKLHVLETGAAYAAAESRSCNRVLSAMISDTSKPGAAMWFVDCENDNRFMVSQKQAEGALARFSQRKLAKNDLSYSCTLSTVADCKLTPAQRNAKGKEIEYVTACDGILQITLVSPSSLDLHRWRYGFADKNKVVVERPFDSQNSFGAMIRSSYRCEINADTSNIEGFSVSGPTGSQRVI
jgi:hypothetical protein